MFLLKTVLLTWSTPIDDSSLYLKYDNLIIISFSSSGNLVELGFTTKFLHLYYM